MALPWPWQFWFFLGIVETLVSLSVLPAALATAVPPPPDKRCHIASTLTTKWSDKACDRPPALTTSPGVTATPTFLTPALPPDRPGATDSIPHNIPTVSSLQAQVEAPPGTPDLDLDPQIIEDSPVLQRWLDEIPDIAADIKYDPAFRTRARVGYAHFPSSDHTSGIAIGIQDVFVGQTPLTVSAEYAANFRGDREQFGVDAQYYLLPLGWYGNVAPVLGYRSVETPDFDSAGINVGFRIILITSRGGGADLSLTQTWISPGTEDEVGVTTFSTGYAVTPRLRLGTDIEVQNTADDQESRVSVLLEWLL
ncbi:MAG: hypothetical protein ACFBSF_05295 [Leptolyngbyaceae cyanobacterium]